MMEAQYKAGDSFVCSCCREIVPMMGDVAYDPQYAGPVCESCEVLSIKASEHLAKAAISRPMASTDVNASNHNRITNFYK